MTLEMGLCKLKYEARNIFAGFQVQALIEKESLHVVTSIFACDQWFVIVSVQLSIVIRFDWLINWLSF